MGSQRNKLENLKMVLFDFDDTLAVHSQGHRISDHLITKVTGLCFSHYTVDMQARY